MNSFEFVKLDLVDQLFERSRDRLAILDLAGTVVAANGAARRDWEASASDALRRERGLLATREGALADLAPAARGIPTKSASWWGPGEVELWPLRDDRGDVAAVGAVLAVWRDPADRLEEAKSRERAAYLAALEAELERSQARIEELREALARSERLQLLGEFVTAIVHDLNNVLASASSAFRMIGRAKQPARAVDLASEGTRALERGASLVRQMLDFARGSREDPAPLSASEVLDRLTQLIRSLASPPIQVEIHTADDVGLILASASRLESVILNLTANARDAMPNGGRLQIRARNADAAELPPELPAGDFVRLDFIDTGEGMGPETLAKVGTPFFTTKGPHHGTGLGLMGAFKFAEEAGGRCVVASKCGVGTTVTLFLARVDADVAADGSLGQDGRGDDANQAAAR
jgi:signal transduction histidine kinase